MHNIEANGEVLKFVIGTLLKHCPYETDRIETCYGPQSPAVDICFVIKSNESFIYFMKGTYDYKSGTNESYRRETVITFEEISSVIDFILSDSRIISGISRWFGENDFALSLPINWCGKYEGIGCRDINIVVRCDSYETEKKYLEQLFNKYQSELERTNTFNTSKEKYMNDTKNSYFKKLTKNQMMALLSKMSKSDLYYLLSELDNETFEKYVPNKNYNQGIKKLFLEKFNEK